MNEGGQRREEGDEGGKRRTKEYTRRHGLYAEINQGEIFRNVVLEDQVKSRYTREGKKKEERWGKETNLSSHIPSPRMML